MCSGMEHVARSNAHIFYQYRMALQNSKFAGGLIGAVHWLMLQCIGTFRLKLDVMSS
jgi:hypothetical protein